MNLSESQIKLLVEGFSGLGRDVAPDDRGLTRDTLAGFINNHGEAKDDWTDESGIRFCVWDNLQRAKGMVRGDLLVADLGELRWAEFTGE